MEKTGDKTSFINRASSYAYLGLPLFVVISFILIFWHLQFYLFSGLDSVWYSYSAAQYSQGAWLSPKATFKGPVFTLLLSLFFRIFGPTLWSSRAVSVLFGGLMPVIVYLLGSELFDKKVGLLSAFFCAVNPLLILYSCLTFREIFFSFTWMCCIYLGIRGLSGNRLYAALSGIAFALASMIIEAGLFIGLGFILYYFLVQKILRKTEKQYVSNNLDVFFFSGVLTLFPLVLRNYFIYGEWRYFWHCVSFMALYILFALSMRILHKRINIIYIDRSRAIKFLILAFTVSVVVFISIEAFRVLTINGIVGFMKLMEYTILPESLGLLAIFSVFGIIQAIRSSRKSILPLSVFLFSIAPLAMAIPSHYYSFANVTLEDLIYRHEVWPIENTYRYISSFVPLLTIFASYGIFIVVNKLGYKTKVTRRTLKTIVISIVVLTVLLQFFYADADVRLRADADSKALEDNYQEVISWLNDRGDPPVYSFNPIFKQFYGDDKVCLLSDENFSDILERASFERIKFIISDTFGSYSDTQFSLFWAGWVGDPEYWVPNNFNLTYSLTNWPLTQIWEISLPTYSVLIIQHDGLGEEWVSLFSNSQASVKVVDDDEGLIQHFSKSYDLIVLADIQRHLENDELTILRQRVANGTVLVINGVSPFYLNLQDNSYWLGATDFIEASKDVKSNITFTNEAKNILAEINTNKSYCLYTEVPYSTPTGCNVLEVNATVYAIRTSDEVPAIFSHKYADGTVIFSGVRPFFSSEAKDYDLYEKFILSTLERYLGA